MTTDFHKKNVETIRAAFEGITKNKWDAGDAALREVPMGTQGGDHTSGSKLTDVSLLMDRLATEAGVNLPALTAYRAMSSLWAPEARQSTVSWTAHRCLLAPSDRMFARWFLGDDNKKRNVQNKEELLAALVIRADKLHIRPTEDWIRVQVGLAGKSNSVASVRVALRKGLLSRFLSGYSDLAAFRLEMEEDGFSQEELDACDESVEDLIQYTFDLEEIAPIVRAALEAALLVN